MPLSIEEVEIREDIRMLREAMGVISDVARRLQNKINSASNPQVYNIAIHTFNKKDILDVMDLERLAKAKVIASIFREI